MPTWEQRRSGAFIETPHNDQNQNRHSWIWLAGSKWSRRGGVTWRDGLGRKVPHPGRRWFVVECNNAQCDAQALIRGDLVTDFMREMLPQAPFDPWEEGGIG